MLTFDLACRTFSLLLAASMLLVAPAYAQESSEPEKPAEEPASERAREAFRDAIERIWVPRHRLSNGSYVRDTFKEVVAEANKATVRVRVGGRTVAFGGVVGPDGWVLTKASRLRDDLTVVLPDKRELDARVVGIDRDHDLAVLKIDAKKLPTLKLDADVPMSPGAWVATPGYEAAPVAVGVLSVLPRTIPHRAGILGVQLGDGERGAAAGALVLKVFADSGAERAGVLVNDLIIKINDKPIRSRQELIREVRRYSPLDELAIKVKRGNLVIDLTATLTGRVKEMFPQSRSQYQNSLGSELSQRRFGFPTALQHDTVLSPSQCGGPLVDLDGRVVGFNIARAGRTESYAIPTKTVLPLMYKLMSGEQAPGEEDAAEADAAEEDGAVEEQAAEETAAKGQSE